MSVLAEKEIDARIIPLEEILYDESFNCRGAISAIEVSELARDIEAHGLMSPVIVAPLPESLGTYKFKLVAGFRRYLAHRVLKKTVIKALVQPELVDQDRALYFNLTENVNRLDLTILQEARAVKKLRERGNTREQIAENLGMSSGWVQIRVMLLELPEPVQELADAKIISQTDIRHLHTTMKHLGPEKCMEQARKVNDAKARGKQIAVDSVKPDTRRIRNKREIYGLMEYCQDTLKMQNGLWSRCLAWATGAIADEELDETINEYCSSNGLEYKPRGGTATD